MVLMLTGRFSHARFKPVDNLDPIVAFASSVFLDHQRHHFLDPLISGKATVATAHSRRRRIMLLSLLKRESITRFSVSWQKGHFIAY